MADMAQAAPQPTTPAHQMTISLPSKKIILDLCGGTGAWSHPYVEAGYDVRVRTPPGFAQAFFEANP